jgi:hypothetical protein
MDLMGDAEDNKKMWIAVVLLSILIFFASLGLRYLFEKRLDFVYAVIATVSCVIALFVIFIFLNVKK